MPQPDTTDYSPFHQTYINHTTHYLSALEAVQSSFSVVRDFLKAIPDSEHLYAYAPGKWTLKEMVQHITDTERILAYRALCIARGDTTPLPGFEENDYALHSGANAHKWEVLIDEWVGHRSSVIQLFKGLGENQLTQRGTVNNAPITANALGFIIAGHSLHHVSIIKERYLDKGYKNVIG